ncbi:hypothetical protein J2X14_003170 [Pantoea alhagi]|nr:hypothetical protein [Pantoea alhagi]
MSVKIFIASQTITPAATETKAESAGAATE